MPKEISTSPLQRAFYWFGKTVCWIYFKIGWRLEVRGQENVPNKGRAVLAANHRSYADPPLVGVSIRRNIHFLAKQELFDFAPFGWTISALNAHPLNRDGSDVAALKLAKHILDAGHMMIVFPEGRRNRSQQLAKPKAGVGLLARMTDSPVIPIYIHNSAEMWSFKRITVTFGKPINPGKFKTNQEVADEVMRQIQKMKDGFPGPARQRV